MRKRSVKFGSQFLGHIHVGGAVVTNHQPDWLMPLYIYIHVGGSNRHCNIAYMLSFKVCPIHVHVHAVTTRLLFDSAQQLSVYTTTSLKR